MEFLYWKYKNLLREYYKDGLSLCMGIPILLRDSKFILKRPPALETYITLSAAGNRQWILYAIFIMAWSDSAAPDNTHPIWQPEFYSVVDSDKNIADVEMIHHWK